MTLRLGKATTMWAFVKGVRVEVWDQDRWKPAGAEKRGETIERVLVTVERVPKRGKGK